MDKLTRILIVDDDERNVRILHEILEDDFELYSAYDGESAFAEVEKVMPDIILLDIMMPGIDGYEVCQRLKQSDEYKKIKIILVSGKALTEERIKGYEVGADDFVIKPFDVDEIFAKVQVFAKLKSLEEVNKLKTDFLSLVNHETGTPLNHIIGTSDLLLMNKSIDPETIEAIQDINTAAHSLHNKINNILFLSKLKQATLENINDVDIGVLITEVSECSTASKKEVDIKYIIEGEKVVNGDFSLLQKLFLYLFEHSVNASKSTMTCTVSDKVEDNITGTLVEFKDSGGDITDTQLMNFFDPFYVDDLMLHSEGLNTIMAICSEIVTLHCGTIKVRRNESSGTCVSVWLPQVRSR